MTCAKQQEGMTLISWMAMLALLAVVVMFLLRVVPAYLEDFSVSTTVKSLREDTLATYSSPDQVRLAITRRFSINNVDNVKSEDVEVLRNGGVFDVNVSYEVRENFMFNIDLVLSFDHHVEVPAS